MWALPAAYLMHVLLRQAVACMHTVTPPSPAAPEGAEGPAQAPAATNTLICHASMRSYATLITLMSSS